MEPGLHICKVCSQTLEMTAALLVCCVKKMICMQVRDLTLCLAIYSCHWCVDSGVGSNVGPSYGSSNLNAVEEADIEAGQILTALKSSPSPIRSVLSIQLFCTSRTHIHIYHRYRTLQYIH